MKKFFRRILLIIINTLILTTVNCFAHTIVTENITIKNNERYSIRTYDVTENEESKFLEELKDEYIKNGILYKLVDVSKDGGNKIEEKQIITTKQITTKTNNKEKILAELPQKIDYNKEGYIGQYELDEENLRIERNYNRLYRISN